MLYLSQFSAKWKKKLVMFKIIFTNFIIRFRLFFYCILTFSQPLFHRSICSFFACLEYPQRVLDNWPFQPYPESWINLWQYFHFTQFLYKCIPYLSNDHIGHTKLFCYPKKSILHFRLLHTMLRCVCVCHSILHCVSIVCNMLGLSWAKLSSNWNWNWVLLDSRSVALWWNKNTTGYFGH